MVLVRVTPRPDGRDALVPAPAIDPEASRYAEPADEVKFSCVPGAEVQAVASTCSVPACSAK